MSLEKHKTYLIKLKGEDIDHLRACLAWMDDMLDCLGGCDHSVGICCCADITLVERLETILEKLPK